MSKIEVDIRTRVLSVNHRVFIVRPGAGYRLYEDVKREKAILYDLPGFTMEGSVRFVDQEDVVAKVLRAQAIRAWYKVGRANGSPFPSTNLDNYPYPEKTADKRSLAQYLSIGRAYFDRSRTGDMVIVPPLRFSDPVLVGEIVDGPPVQAVAAQYGDQPLSGRRVRWLAEIKKNDVPSRVIEISQKPNSFVQLERASSVWFYDRAYKSYVLDGSYQAEFRITSREFGSSDDARITAFLNFVAAIYAASLGAGKNMPIEKAVFAALGEFEPEKRISINSPGEIIVHAMKLTPLIFLTLMAMCSAVAPADVLQAVADDMLTIRNSSELPGDGCAAEVYTSTLDWLRTVGAQEWLDACALAKQAIDSAGVEIPATVTVTP